MAPQQSRQSEVLRFPYNVPQLCCLKFEAPKLITTKYGERAFFSLKDGRIMFLETEVAETILALDIHPGEDFYIARRSTKERGTYWDVWLAPDTERARAKAEEPEIQSQLLESILHQEYKNGNGANGVEPLAPSQSDKERAVKTLSSIPQAQAQWAEAILEQAKVKLTLYHQLVEWAKANLAGMTRNEVRAILMNVMISSERT